MFLSWLVRELFSRWEKVEERMSGVRGILDYACCFAKAAGSVDRVNGWEAALCDGLGYIHDLLRILLSWTEQEPYQAVIQAERMLSMVQL